MKRETIVWSIVLLIGVALVAARVFLLPGGIGKAYIRVNENQFVHANVPVAPDAPAGAQPKKEWVKVGSKRGDELGATAAQASISWTSQTSVTPRQFAEANRAQPGQTHTRLSLSRTIGIWVAAFFTLAIFSFLYKDNPFYKIAESVVVGVSAAYWMVVGFWEVIVPNLIARVAPRMTMDWSMPGLEGRDTQPDYWFIVPLILGGMLLWRLAPKGAWIARWPLAFVIGTTAGMRLTGFLHADFLSQIRATIVPFAVMDNGQFDLWKSVSNIVVVIGVLTCLVYFFFSFEHKGIVGRTARVGIWFLMITFGAAFGYTVMGRIALLAGRLEFLFDDWLWLIDPSGRRESMVSAAMPLLGIW